MYLSLMLYVTDDGTLSTAYKVIVKNVCCI